MKKKLLIFFIVLIVIFLIISIITDNDIEKKINNTIDKISDKDYKITLTLKNTSSLDNEEITSKIKYIEKCNKDKYQLINKGYINNKLTDDNTIYIYKNNFYSSNNNYEKRAISNKNIKDFDFNLNRFFSKFKSIHFSKYKDGKLYYKARMDSEDAFSLIYPKYKNKNLKKNTSITLITYNDLVEEIYFTSNDKNNKYSVNLKLDCSIQNINIPKK